MRIEGKHLAAADVAKGISDIIGRLDTGDIVRAKVLQISSDEAVLRLSDGSVIKATLTEKLDAKAGQTVMLTVTNKINGTLVLETVKDSNQSNMLQTDIIKAMLHVIKLPADSKNMSLMSEFVSLNLSPGVEQMKDALAMLTSSGEIDAEKAVFLASKGIHPDNESIEDIVKLLGGEIKLGEIIKEIELAVENLRSNLIGTNSNTNTHKGQELIRIIASALNKAFEDAAAKETLLTSNTSIVSRIAQQHSSSPGNSSANDSAVDSSASDSAVNSSASGSETSSPSSFIISFGSSSESSSITSSDSSFDNMDPGDSATKGNNEAISNRQENRNADMDAKSIDVLKDSAIKDPFIRLKETIEQIFIKIKAGELLGESDIKSIETEINDKLNLLRTVASLPEITQLEEGRDIIEVVSRLDDTVKAMNHLINNNIAYYQLPINLPGHNTNAEIYIMKSKKKKRKIDPQDTVLFLSLDTKNIGRVEALIVLKKKNVSIKFRTERQQVIDFGKENIKTLYVGFESIGYKLVSIKYEMMEAPTPPVGIEKLISKFLKESQNKVDLRI